MVISSLRRVPALFRRLLRDKRGNVAMLFGLMIIPLMLAGGAAVDYSRGAQLRTQLQGIVDQAAVSAAASFTTCNSATAVATVAKNYFNKAVSNLPPNGGFGSGPTVTTNPASCSTGATNFSVTVAASTTIETSLLRMFIDTLPINVSATAKMPGVAITFNFADFSSNACDTNSIYWYYVPTDGSLPATSSLNLLWSNANSSNPTVTTTQVSANQQLGFALKNVTGGNCSYGSNGYGSPQGTAHYFYSQLSPPNKNSYPSTITEQVCSKTNNKGQCTKYTSETIYSPSTDCTLQVIKGTAKNGAYTFANPSEGCSSGSAMTTDLTNAAPTCANLGGVSYKYYWNDMGGTADDGDYNDMEYSFSCSGGSGSANGTANGQPLLTN